MYKCEQCSIEYEAKRATSRYCSGKCKQASYRNKDRTVSVTVTPVSVTEPVTVTELAKPTMTPRRYTGILTKAKQVKGGFDVLPEQLVEALSTNERWVSWPDSTGRT